MAKSKGRLRWLHRHKDWQGADCLIWPFARYLNGYPAMSLDGESMNASHLMCEIAHGPRPTDDHDAAHNCGNGYLGCVHPEHLSWKTKIENEADKIAHGTQARGEYHGRSKLTESDVFEIRRLLSAGKTQTLIAELFGVKQTAVSDIKRGRVWSWLNGEPRWLNKLP